MFVQPASLEMPYTAQLDAAQKTYQSATVSKFTPKFAPNRSAEVTLTTPDGRTITAFVNPYTGEVLGDRDEDNNFQSIVRFPHSSAFSVKLYRCPLSIKVPSVQRRHLSPAGKLS